MLECRTVMGMLTGLALMASVCLGGATEYMVQLSKFIFMGYVTPDHK